MRWCLPGLRSTPLVLALHAYDAMRIRVVLDERDAAFVALGIARALGEPVMLVVHLGFSGCQLPSSYCGSVGEPYPFGCSYRGSTPGASRVWRRPNLSISRHFTVIYTVVL